MTSTQVLDLKGKKVGDFELEDTVFGIEPAKGPLHTALLRQLANARSGAANCKTRAEVRGGGAKPWRQKGTGRARAGSSRSPLWRTGGVIFGPKPRSYNQSMPKKMRQLAVRSALSARKDELVVVKDFEAIKEPKTKAFAAVLKELALEGKKVLLVLDFACDNCKTVQLAARNVKGVKVIYASNLNVKDLLEYDAI
ncbi:MAG: 50S ribosomal protein L4, partial [Candidatus Obscuribacterales bacterium]|nr:50S ribosomal protein L4 [Candidatus Obscuribacterales bacterium]